MHGSIDWFDKADYERRVEHHKEAGAGPPRDYIFSNESKFSLEPIVDGPRPGNDPLNTIYRAKNLDAAYEEDFLFSATPKILSPSATKLLYATSLNNFWEGMLEGGYNNFGMAIVGFSLPSHDDYALQILYEIVTNYQRYNWDGKDFGVPKTPLSITDFFSDKDAEEGFHNRYRFVDLSRAQINGEGFGINSLDSIFS